MCGIFGFSFNKPVQTSRAFRVLQKLETSQLPQEPLPVGGYGAGVAVLLEDGNVLVKKSVRSTARLLSVYPRLSMSRTHRSFLLM